MPKIMALIAILCVCGVSAYADVDVGTLADAIKQAENSDRHPYGIMTRYKHTTPRQACINTIKHAMRDYKGPDEGFIDFLGARYAPIGVKNDPKGLNANWVRNVKYFYSKGLTS